MKRWMVLVVFIAGCVSAPGIKAQDHIAIGAFGEYFNLNQTHANLAGLGARAGVNVSHYFMLEAEMSYDFNRVFTENFNDGLGNITAVNSNLRVLHGLFGPKVQTKGPVKFFLTAKGGFINFRFDPRPPSFSTFTSSVDNLRDSNVQAVFYPGLGFEANLGPFGLRLDAGDEMFFQNGVHHNVRVTFGPQIRF